jgi:hypothetical protein
MLVNYISKVLIRGGPSFNERSSLLHLFVEIGLWNPFFLLGVSQ